jgi:hypothetical protein
MGQQSPGFLERLGLGQSLKRWRRALQAGGLSAADLRAMLSEMASLQKPARHADGGGADGAVCTGRRKAGCRSTISSCDWSGRPGAWREAMRPRGIVDLPSPTALPGGVTVYHDAARYDLSLRQELAPEGYGDARFGLVLEVYRFDGSFVSFVHDLPPEAIAGLTLNHFIAVDLGRSASSRWRSTRG